jgi:hypothetical protein
LFDICSALHIIKQNTGTVHYEIGLSSNKPALSKIMQSMNYFFEKTAKAILKNFFVQS